MRYSHLCIGLYAAPFIIPDPNTSMQNEGPCLPLLEQMHWDRHPELQIPAPLPDADPPPTLLPDCLSIAPDPLWFDGDSILVYQW